MESYSSTYCSPLPSWTRAPYQPYSSARRQGRPTAIEPAQQDVVGFVHFSQVRSEQLHTGVRMPTRDNV
jgi:hypothetical protein